ncbi:unnamed protein product [Trifolium pratense]|uniref:Uncharacterized protein n=1 Tax=Trifolium pratense TaxID=57577 RepID=A0ACB0JUK5_TRIPR|nr:unnamed protein product [Trifolium pratense]
MATAGMRMLDVELQEKNLDSCIHVLRSSGFKFCYNWASVITGSDEGVYAWVVANYALGTLRGDPLKTTGIIELGASQYIQKGLQIDPCTPAGYSYNVDSWKSSPSSHSEKSQYQPTVQTFLSADLPH